MADKVLCRICEGTYGKCPICNGSCCCLKCNGTGQIMHMMGFPITCPICSGYKKCISCKGTGCCSACEGSGWISIKHD